MRSFKNISYKNLKINRHSPANRKSVKLKELAGETFIMLSELDTEQTDHLPALKKTSRVAVPIEDEEVNVKFYAVCRVEMMRQLNSVLKQP